jgi:hypothetical protein
VRPQVTLVPIPTNQEADGMDNPILDIEDARARLEAWKERAEQRAAEVVRDTIGTDSATGRAMLAGFPKPEAPEQEWR